MKKKLYRSEKDKKFFGVCGGIAEYFEFDSALVRLVWILLTILCAGFPGFTVYVVCALVIPSASENQENDFSHENVENLKSANQD